MKSFFKIATFVLFLLIATPLTLLSQSIEPEAPVICPDDMAPPKETASTDAALINDLIFQYEEDSMARALYTEFYKVHQNIMPFRNIPERGETHHVNGIYAELERRGASDRVADFKVGEFTNPAMQAAYERLLAQGQESLEGAIKSALEIEEGDIAGLRKLAGQTDDAEADALYAFLEMGSHHHLRAFARQAEIYSVVYEPKHLSVEAYATALNPEADGDAVGSSCGAQGNGQGCGGCGNDAAAQKGCGGAGGGCGNGNAAGCSGGGCGGGQGQATQVAPQKTKPQAQQQRQQQQRRRMGRQ